MQLLLDSAPQISTLGIVFSASAGLVLAIVALIKLPRERNESAVTQAQGAMETMVELNERLEKALDRANARGDIYRDQNVELRAQLERLQDRYDKAVAQWGPFPDEA